MRRVPFSIERTMQAAARSAGSGARAEVAHRQCESMHFEECVTGLDREPSQTLHLGRRFKPSHRIVALDAMRLHGPSYSVLDGSNSLLLTHVLRNSPSSLKWRNGWGEISRLEPGGVFINQGRRDSLIEVSPSPPNDHCDCLRVVLRTRLSFDLSLRYGAHDFLFCNSPQACVRIMLGSYRGHVALYSPLPDLTLLDIDIAPFSEIEVPVTDDASALAILTSGSLECSGTTLQPWHAMAFHGREPLVKLATQTGASVLWLGIPNDAAPALRRAEVA